jgi:hypothetical protein
MVCIGGGRVRREIVPGRKSQESNRRLLMVGNEGVSREVSTEGLWNFIIVGYSTVCAKGITYGTLKW